MSIFLARLSATITLTIAIVTAVLPAAPGGLAAAETPQATTIFVSPDGKAGNPGTKKSPLATLEAARDAARQAGTGPKRIVVLPGEYFLARTFELDARDNGLTIEAGEDGPATLYGGTLVTGWRPDNGRFWSAELPGVKEGTWDFRALAVNGCLRDRARLPESGTFLHQSTFNVPWLSSVGGGWERKPTEKELTTMVYDPKDIPATLETKNAEVRVYHMWDESMVGVTREPSRWSATGAPVYAYLAYDDRFLYVAINVAMFEASKLRTGPAWGEDDGAEFCIAGRTPDGKSATFVIRGFADGAAQSVTDAGAPRAAAELLGKAVRFIAKPYGKTMGGWRGQWIIPWEALGLTVKPGLKVPFNLGVFRSEDEVWRCWEGTLAENWRLDQAGQLLFQ